MHGDYIEVAGIEDEGAVLSALIRILNPIAVRGGNTATFPVLAVAGGLEVVVDEHTDGAASLAIGEAAGADPIRRRRCARRLYRSLARDTRWSLCWTADDVAGVLSSRPNGPWGPAVVANAPTALYATPRRSQPEAGTIATLREAGSATENTTGAQT